MSSVETQSQSSIQKFFFTDSRLIAGPMMMSYAVAGHLTYRLTEEAGGTRLVLTHQAIGLLKAEHMEGMPKGWGQFLDDAKARSEKVAHGLRPNT